MIVLNLTCANHHFFEGWFASAEEFSRQSANQLVSCPLCNDANIIRLPSTPHVKRATSSEPQPVSPKRLLGALNKLVSESEDVGDRFPEEARKIHYDEVEERNIRGLASPDEVQSLLDEGIPVIPLPFPPKKESH